MSNSKAKNLDKLTGLPLYDAFSDDLDRAISEAESRGSPLSLAQVDIDEFKKINDTHGPPIGDEVLKSVTAHLVESTQGKGNVFRYGGDELMVLLPGIEKEEAFLLLEQTRKDFDREHLLKAGSDTAGLRIGLSVGIASRPDDGVRSQELIRKTNDALHRAKTTGRNKVSLAREERMVTKTSHYTHGQLERLSDLAGREGVGEAILLREALDDLLRKYAQ